MMEKIIDVMIDDVQLVVFCADKRIAMQYAFELKKPNATDIFSLDFLSTLKFTQDKKTEIIEWILEDVIKYWEMSPNEKNYIRDFFDNTEDLDTASIKKEHEEIMEKQQVLRRIVNQEWIDGVKLWSCMMDA